MWNQFILQLSHYNSTVGVVCVCFKLDGESMNGTGKLWQFAMFYFPCDFDLFIFGWHLFQMFISEIQIPTRNLLSPFLALNLSMVNQEM